MRSVSQRRLLVAVGGAVSMVPLGQAASTGRQVAVVALGVASNSLKLQRGRQARLVTPMPNSTTPAKASQLLWQPPSKRYFELVHWKQVVVSPVMSQKLQLGLLGQLKLKAARAGCSASNSSSSSGSSGGGGGEISRCRPRPAGARGSEARSSPQSKRQQEPKTTRGDLGGR